MIRNNANGGDIGFKLIDPRKCGGNVVEIGVGPSQGRIDINGDMWDSPPQKLVVDG